MQPKYIPLFLVLIAAFGVGLYMLMMPDQKAAPVTEEKADQIASQYNFLDHELTVPEAGVTEEDIAAYESVKAEVTEAEHAAFYEGAASAYQSLEYGGYLDGEVDTEATTTDPDLLVELMMTDIDTLTAEAAASQQYRPPVYTEEVVPAYVEALAVTYPPHYLTEVMVRDQLLATLYPDYEAPDRTDYIEAGLRAGWYWEGDVEVAEEFVQWYMLMATGSSDFFLLTEAPVEAQEEVSTTNIPSLDTLLEADADLRAEYEEYQAAVDAAQEAYITSQTSNE